jgi:hypothetical protein
MPTVISARTLSVLLVAIAVAGCAPGLAPSADVTTITQGWERYFRIDATTTPTPGGTEIDGYIYNLYGRPAEVRLLAQALDASNTVVAQKIEWVLGGVPQLNRAYFKISPLPPADQYRVSVWSFDIIDTSDFPRRRF